MAPALDGSDGGTQSQWLAQMKAMRDAIAELKLPQVNGHSTLYGHDIVVGDDDSVGASSGDDLWDLISSDEEEESMSSDDMDSYLQNESGDTYHGMIYDHDWLSQVCVSTASRKSGLDPTELQEQVSALLASGLEGL